MKNKGDSNTNDSRNTWNSPKKIKKKLTTF